jgi:hypothetical protein
MAFQVPTIVLLGQAAITASVTTLYTVPANSRTYLENLDIVNTNSTTTTFDVYLVPSGGTAGTGNALFYQQTLSPKQNMQWTGLQVLNAAYKIQVNASATGVTIIASGETYEYN